MGRLDHPPASAPLPHALPPPTGYPGSQHQTPTSAHPQTSPTYGHGGVDPGQYGSSLAPQSGPGYHLPPPQPDNGYPHPIAPLPPPRPVDHGYGSTQYGQPTPASYSALPARKKPNRAAQACNICRLKKQKCDEKHPCSSCAKDGLDCQYRGSQQSKPDRVLDAVQRMLEHTMDDFHDKLEQIAVRMGGIENSLGVATAPTRPSTSRVGRKPAPINTFAGGQTGEYDDEDDDEDEDEDGEQLETGPTFREGSPRKFLKRAQMSVPRAEDLNVPVAYINLDQGSLGDTDGSTEFGLSRSALIREHTTGAHHLSKWRYIDRLFEGVPEGYAIKAEKDQGNLRPNGTGPAVPEEHPAQPELRSPYDDDGRHPSEFSDPIWTGEVSGPKLMPDAILTDHPGGLNAFGDLNLEEKTVHMLKDSYLRHMHSLHPFIHRQYLERLVRNFLFTNSPSHGYTNGSEVAGMKRKRSTASDGSPIDRNHNSNPATPSLPRPGRRRPEHSVTNAIVLLVMALGKILDFKGPLPPIPAHLREDCDRGSPMSLHGFHDGPSSRPATGAGTAFSSPGLEYSKMSQPSPSQESVTHPNQGMARANRPMPPPPPPTVQAQAGNNRKGKTCSVNSTAGCLRNMDVLPGVAYYAYATTILGGIAGGHTLSHVHAYLLAGLMMGQLARVTESWHWINLACRTCLLLIKEDLDTLRSPLEPGYAPPKPGSGWKPHDIEAIKFAFWTCLQLESDILAEFETLPHSGISGYEDKIGYPSTMGDQDKLSDEDYFLESSQDEERIVMFYYSSQIFLRKMLNLVHSRVYPKEAANGTDSTAKLLGTDFFAWRRGLPESLNWDDNSFRSPNIHMARLRGKFYGGGYIITRPFLHRVIGKFTEDDIRLIDPVLLVSPPEPLTEIPEFSSNRTERLNQIVQVAKWCLWFAIRSTTAFDELPDRWRITNIHGTLTAQFSNMLVLYAAYNSCLSATLPKELVLQLFNRTIKHIDKMSGMSLSLKINARILRRARDSIEGKRPYLHAIGFGGDDRAGFHNGLSSIPAARPRGSNGAGKSAASSTSTRASGNRQMHMSQILTSTDGPTHTISADMVSGDPMMDAQALSR